MRGIEDPKAKLSELKNDGRRHVSLFGNYFQQNKVIIPNNNNLLNIYCVYELRQVNIPLSIEFTILNALFGAMEITFTQPNKKFVLSLHYNDDNSYLFVNGKQELKFKCKTDQLVKKKLCIGNLSNNWSPIEAQKTGLYGNIYDFVVDYKAINGVKKICDMHRYLMTKHDII